MERYFGGNDTDKVRSAAGEALKHYFMTIHFDKNLVRQWRRPSGGPDLGQPWPLSRQRGAPRCFTRAERGAMQVRNDVRPYKSVAETFARRRTDAVREATFTAGVFSNCTPAADLQGCYPSSSA